MIHCIKFSYVLQQELRWKDMLHTKQLLIKGKREKYFKQKEQEVLRIRVGFTFQS